MSPLTHPAYGMLRTVSPIASVLLERNPNMMTLDGTNSWVLRGSDASDCVIVDPGEDDSEHLTLLARSVPVAMVVLTHHHVDHVQGAPRFAKMVNAPVRALDAALCVGAEPLADGEVIEAAGLRLRVLHTPGHSDDSVSLVVDGETRAVLTGDTILGTGTTVLHRLTDYMDSLRTLAALPEGTLGLPGHGPELADLCTTAREYLAHREQRLDQVRAALRELGADAGVRQVVEHVYTDVDPALWAPAESSVRAQLEYLRARG